MFKKSQYPIFFVLCIASISQLQCNKSKKDSAKSPSRKEQFLPSDTDVRAKCKAENSIYVPHNDECRSNMVIVDPCSIKEIEEILYDKTFLQPLTERIRAFEAANLEVRNCVYDRKTIIVLFGKKGAQDIFASFEHPIRNDSNAGNPVVDDDDNIVGSNDPGPNPPTPNQPESKPDVAIPTLDPKQIKKRQQDLESRFYNDLANQQLQVIHGNNRYACIQFRKIPGDCEIFMKEKKYSGKCDFKTSVNNLGDFVALRCLNGSGLPCSDSKEPMRILVSYIFGKDLLDSNASIDSIKSKTGKYEWKWGQNLCK